MIKNYLYSWTENFRERLAWKIFPEMNMYLEVVKRVSAMDENDRCIKVLRESDSGCSGWAEEEIRIKYVGLEQMYRNFKEEGFDEPPF